MCHFGTGSLRQPCTITAKAQHANVCRLLVLLAAALALAHTRLRSALLCRRTRPWEASLLCFALTLMVPDPFQNGGWTVHSIYELDARGACINASVPGAGNGVILAGLYSAAKLS